MSTLKIVAIAVCASALAATSAVADVVCNEEGDCWHVHGRAEYDPELRFAVHPDNWTWGEHEHGHYRWREHEGQGYWRGGVWTDLGHGHGHGQDHGHGHEQEDRGHGHGHD